MQPQKQQEQHQSTSGARKQTQHQRKSHSQYEEYKFQQANNLISKMRGGTIQHVAGATQQLPHKQFKHSRTFSNQQAMQKSVSQESHPAVSPRRRQIQVTQVDEEQKQKQSDSDRDSNIDEAKELVPDIFQLPLKRMPSIVDIILNSKSQREIRNLERRIFRDERSSLETLMPSMQSAGPDSNKGSFVQPNASRELVAQDEYFQGLPDVEEEFKNAASKFSAKDRPQQPKGQKVVFSQESGDHSEKSKLRQVQDHLASSSVANLTENKSFHETNFQDIPVSDVDRSKRQDISDEQTKKSANKYVSITNTTDSVGEAEDDDQTLVLQLMHQNLQRRITAPARSHTLHRKVISHTAETISGIFCRAPSERSKQDYEEIHRYMKKNVKLFRNDKGAGNFMREATGEEDSKLSYDDAMKLYQVMMYKVFRQGENMCEYNAYGDRFYIILEGAVSVLQPKEVDMHFNLLWDLYKFVIQVYDRVRTFRDEKSKELGAMISIVGAPLLRSLNFKHVRKLMEFLRKLEILSEELFEKHPSLDRRKINANPHRLKNIRVDLDKQLKQIDETTKGSFSIEQPLEKKIISKFIMMEQVNTLSHGDSFGQDSLSSEQKKRRNATCQAISKRVIAAVLTKNDFQRVLNEYEKQKTDIKINKIRQFDLFKSVTNKRLKNMFRFFYNPTTEEPYTAQRNQYLFRQSDPVDGIYCIISGQVKQIKETWSINEKEVIKVQKSKEDILNTEGSTENLKNTQIGVINELRRNKAKQIVLTILQNGEVLGIEEVINKQPRRNYSIQVCSEGCEYLFLTTKNFKEKFYNHSIVMKQMLNGRVEQRQKFHGELEIKKRQFEKRNAVVQEDKLNKQETPFSLKLMKSNNQAASSVEKDLNQSSQKVQEILAKNLVKDPAQKKHKTALPGSATKEITSKQGGPHVGYFEDEEVISPVEVLEQKITEEIESEKPNITKMVCTMKERRKEQAQEKEEIKKARAMKLKELSSSSQVGKIMEQNLCKRFNATHVEDPSKMSKSSGNKFSILKIQQKLVKDADDYYLMWKNERLQEEQVDLILQSLTHDKRIQRQIKKFGDKTRLLSFIEFIKEKGPDFIRRLNVPIFEGNLLLEDVKSDRRSPKGHFGESNYGSLSSGLRENTGMMSQTMRGGKPISVQLSGIQKQESFNNNSKRSEMAVKKRGSRCLSMSSGADIPEDDQLDIMKVFFDFLEFYQNRKLRQQNSSLMRRKSADLIAERTKQTCDILSARSFPTLGRFQSAEVLIRDDFKSFAAGKRENNSFTQSVSSQLSKATSARVFSPARATSEGKNIASSSSDHRKQRPVNRFVKPLTKIQSSEEIAVSDNELMASHGSNQLLSNRLSSSQVQFMQQQKSHTSRSLTRIQEQKNQKIINDPIPEEELQPNNTIDFDNNEAPKLVNHQLQSYYTYQDGFKGLNVVQQQPEQQEQKDLQAPLHSSEQAKSENKSKLQNENQVMNANLNLGPTYFNQGVRNAKLTSQKSQRRKQKAFMIDNAKFDVVFSAPTAKEVGFDTLHNSQTQIEASPENNKGRNSLESQVNMAEARQKYDDTPAVISSVNGTDKRVQFGHKPIQTIDFNGQVGRATPSRDSYNHEIQSMQDSKHGFLRPQSQQKLYDEPNKGSMFSLRLTPNKSHQKPFRETGMTDNPMSRQIRQSKYNSKNSWVSPLEQRKLSEQIRERHEKFKRYQKHSSASKLEENQYQSTNMQANHSQPALAQEETALHQQSRKKMIIQTTKLQNFTAASSKYSANNNETAGPKKASGLFTSNTLNQVEESSHQSQYLRNNNNTPSAYKPVLQTYRSSKNATERKQQITSSMSRRLPSERKSEPAFVQQQYLHRINSQRRDQVAQSITLKVPEDKKVMATLSLKISNGAGTSSNRQTMRNSVSLPQTAIQTGGIQMRPSNSSLTQNLFEVNHHAINAMSKKQQQGKLKHISTPAGLKNNSSVKAAAADQQPQLKVESREYQRFTDKVIQTMQNRAKRIEQSNYMLQHQQQQSQSQAQGIGMGQSQTSQSKPVLINRPAGGHYGTKQSHQLNVIGPNHYLRDWEQRASTKQQVQKQPSLTGRATPDSMNRLPQPAKSNSKHFSKQMSRNEQFSGNARSPSSHLGSSARPGLLIPKQSWN